MKDLIAEAIASCQMRIKEFQMIQKHVEDNIYDTVQFRIETKNKVGPYWDYYTAKRKDKLVISPEAMLLILNELIKKERNMIDYHINCEIESRNKRCQRKRHVTKK